MKVGLFIAILGFSHPVFGMLEGSFLYFPSHSKLAADLSEWHEDGKLLGYSSMTASPKMVWLVCHGNGGQAAQRGYIRDILPNGDSFYVVEYPGYGSRSGSPSMQSINEVAAEAYAVVRRLHPNLPVGIVGESLGSGPASYLCSLTHPPDRVVLIVPFDNLLSVAQEHFWWLPVALLMRDKWDNSKSLSKYSGRIDIYGAMSDGVVPVHHARSLAASLPAAIYHELKCGHNDWSGLVRISER